ncbi:MAG: OB-fold nucleic acid binding domain-containing protein, partial [Pseudoflavonifractor sp.]
MDNIKSSYRDQTCGALRMEHLGQTVTLVGFFDNIREVGSELAFVVLRDFYGATQLVLETPEMVATMKAINKESTLQVEGLVRERASKNPNMPTGDIEVLPTKITVLGRCRHNELPFQINRSR